MKDEKEFKLRQNLGNMHLYMDANPKGVDEEWIKEWKDIPKQALAYIRELEAEGRIYRKLYSMQSIRIAQMTWKHADDIAKKCDQIINEEFE